LGWLSLAGFGVAVWAFQLDPRFDTRPVIRLAFAMGGFFYGTSALAAAIGLWRARTWSLKAVYVWGASVVLAAWLPTLALRNQPPLSVAIGGTVMAGLLVLVLALFVKSRLRREYSRAA
jgi:xanthine/uracil permease